MADNIIGTVLISEEEIQKRAKEIGEQITNDFAGEEVVLIGILRGSMPWMAELMKRINLDVEIDFMVCSSYGSGKTTSGQVKIVKDLEFDISGKNVIVVEDIVDSGVTLKYLKSYLLNRDVASLRLCTLLDKPSGRKEEIHVDYVGFTVEDLFIVGYGLDYDQKYRNLPYISYLND